MIQKFKEEERAQGAIEYILLAGGIIVAAVIIFSIYTSMVSSAGQSLNASTAETVGRINTSVGSQTI